ncbi:hypothetical protein RvY_06309-3 [Ramazzottius varieornatus]|nr:hypothetical protein RvY_06309-3 [Ramazzottius varieornatus]
MLDAAGAPRRQSYTIACRLILTYGRCVSVVVSALNMLSALRPYWKSLRFQEVQPKDARPQLNSLRRSVDTCKDWCYLRRLAGLCWISRSASAASMIVYMPRAFLTPAPQ